MSPTQNSSIATATLLSWSSYCVPHILVRAVSIIRSNVVRTNIWPKICTKLVSTIHFSRVFEQILLYETFFSFRRYQFWPGLFSVVQTPIELTGTQNRLHSKQDRTSCSNGNGQEVTTKHHLANPAPVVDILAMENGR